MKNIQSLLERISKSLNKDSFQRSIVIEVVAKKTGVTLSPTNIFIKNHILQLTGSPALKNEIRLNEEEILKELRNLHQLPVSKILFN